MQSILIEQVFHNNWDKDTLYSQGVTAVIYGITLHALDPIC